MTNILLHENSVSAALEALRTGKTLGEHPLRHFRSVQAHLEIPHHLTESEAIQNAIFSHLSHIIIGQLARLRRQMAQFHTTPEPPPPDKDCTELYLAQDYQQNSATLEAWSTLYHRYVCYHYDLSPEALAQIAVTTPRQIQRRRRQGIRRLISVLIEDEQVFRRQHKLEQLMLALPVQYPPRFFGDESLLPRARRYLLESPPPHHALLHGPSGIGKSTLAKNIAHKMVTSEEIDDFLWLKVDDPDHLISEIAARLGLSSGPDSLRRLRAYLYEHPTLIVLDSAEQLVDHANGADILTALNAASVLLTSSLFPAATTWNCYVLTLSELTREQAFDYLDYLAHQFPERSHPHWLDVFDDYWRAMGGNPRALKVLLFQARTLPVNAAILADADLYELAANLWNELTSAERRVMLLPILFGEDGILYEQIQTLSGLAVDTMDHALASLVDRAILLPHHEANRVRYTLQPLTLTFLIEHIRQGLTLTDRESAQDYLRKVMDRVVAGVKAQVEPVSQAFNVLDLMHNLKFPPEERLQYARALVTPITAESYWSAWITQLKRLLDSPLLPNHVAWIHLALGSAFRWLGEFDDAQTHLDTALTFFSSPDDDPVAYADILIEQVVIERYRLHWDTARDLAQRALALYRHAGHAAGISRCLHELAQLALDEQNPIEALSWLDRVSDWLPRTWGIASQTHLLLGEHTRALDAAQHALNDLPLKHPNSGRAATTLGQIYYEMGDTQAAIASLMSATLLLDETKDLLGYARACNNLAVAYIDDLQTPPDEDADDEDAQMLAEERQRRAREINDLLHHARKIQMHVGDEMGLLVTDQNLAWFARHFPDL